MDQGGRYSQIPIPSYEEATSSRPASSQQYRGPQEVSDDAERQGLLNDSNEHTYRPATVESARSSVDSDLQLPEVNGENDRRRIEELDYLDPEEETGRAGVYHRARLRSQFSKHLANISATFFKPTTPLPITLFACCDRRHQHRTHSDLGSSCAPLMAAIIRQSVECRSRNVPPLRTHVRPVMRSIHDFSPHIRLVRAGHVSKWGKTDRRALRSGVSPAIRAGHDQFQRTSKHC